MRREIFIVMSIVGTTFLGLNGQDTSITQKAVKHYQNYFQSREEFMDTSISKYFDMHDYPPTPRAADSLNRVFVKIKLSELSNSLDIQVESAYSFQDSIEILLKIREYQEGGRLPDPFFDTLLHKYYEVLPSKALEFCLQRFDYYRYHEKDRESNVESRMSFHLYRFPYIEFLFKQLNSSELADLLLHHSLDEPDRNEKMVDRFIEAMHASWKPAELESIKDYLDIKKNFYNADEINMFFVESMLKKR